MNGGRYEIMDLYGSPFDKLRANGLVQTFLKNQRPGTRWRTPISRV
jgi:hypothetical protein